MTLRIGITGHRPNKLPRDWRDWLPARLESVMRRLAELRAAQTGASPHLELVTGLAAGTDTAAAEAVLALGGSVIAILPFDRAEFEKDFEDGAERSAYLAMLAKASEVRELPGSRTAEGEAYEAVGLAMLDASDVVIAVWNGGGSGGRGGTREILDTALARGMPVVHIASDGGEDVRVIAPGPEGVGGRTVAFFDAPSSRLLDLLALHDRKD